MTAPFVHVRIMGTSESQKLGHAPKALDAWAAGGTPDDLQTVTRPKPDKAKLDTTVREIFLYVISGFKERNPAVAMGLIDRL